jgi:hypothetical protein
VLVIAVRPEGQQAVAFRVPCVTDAGQAAAADLGLPCHITIAAVSRCHRCTGVSSSNIISRTVWHKKSICLNAYYRDMIYMLTVTDTIQKVIQTINRCNTDGVESCSKATQLSVF